MSITKQLDALAQYRTWTGRRIRKQHVRSRNPIEHPPMKDLATMDCGDAQEFRPASQHDPILFITGGSIQETPPERHSLRNLVVLIHEGACAPGFWDWKLVSLDDDPIAQYGEFLNPKLEKTVSRIVDVAVGFPDIDKEPSSPTLERSVSRIVDVATNLPGEKPQSEWTKEKNRRRCELVDKEIDGTLSPSEKSELEALQAEMLAYRRKVAPLPLKDLRELHQELLLKFHQQSE